MRAAALSLRFYQSGGRCMVDVSVGDDRIDRIRGQSWGNAQRQRAVLARSLVAARTTLGFPGGEVDLDRAYECLKAVNQAGLDTLQRVLGKDQAYALVGHFRATIPDLRDDIRTRTCFPIVEIEMEDDLLQFEVLPLAGLEQIPRFNTLDDLMRTAGLFAGFAFVTRRIGRGDIQQEQRLLGGSHVPVKMFRHAGYSGSTAEAAHLARNFVLDGGGPWPDASGHSIETAVRAIVYCDRNFAGQAKPTVDQIHHFSCHSALSDEGSYLEFRATEDDPAPIRIVPSDFNAEYMLAKECDPYARPFAFLNACETNCQNTDGFADWTSTLLEAGYRAVIGTEAPVPDVFGSEFSQTFYAQLKASHSVGEALQRAKWSLLRRWKNPMGLLYTLCGSPELFVEELDRDR